MPSTSRDDFLTPFSARFWLKLAVVVLFISGIGGPSLPTGNVGPVDSQPADISNQIDYSMEEILFGIAIIVGIVLIIGLVLAFISAILEFVFLESLRSGQVRIRQFARENLGRGLQLFLFRILINAALLLLIGLPVLALILRGQTDALAILTVIGLIGFGLLAFFIVTIVMRLTTDFVAPVMLLEERGIISSWRAWFETLRAEPWEYVAYLLLVWFLQLIAGTAAFIVIALGGIIIAIPFLLILLGVWLSGVGFASTVGVLILVPTVLVGGLLLTLWGGVVMVPVETYFTVLRICWCSATQSPSST
ncbi:MAG: hypothetical protein U5K37_01385 [Natrialbaceae archaeon]|nr:hypothetical protein [Natrialbaceae archaeon]